MKKFTAFVLCMSMLNMGFVYATEPPMCIQEVNQECIVCSEEMQELATAMGYEIAMTGDGLLVNNIYTSEKMLINPEGSSQYCTALVWCMIFTFFIAFGIFFFPCYLLWAGSCT